MKIIERVSVWYRKFWRRLSLRRWSKNDSRNQKKLEAYYFIKDPWRMSSPAEQYRFIETNRRIVEKFGKLKTILEIGCGEGHQSLYFQKICGQLTGIDVSRRAVSRASKRCPTGRFLVGDIFTSGVGGQAPFDLVVACEVLYYLNDLRLALMRLEELSKNRLLTYHAGQMPNLDPELLTLPGAETEIIEFENSRWRIVWWTQVEDEKTASGLINGRPAAFALGNPASRLR